jgi:hypothetical protein
MGRAPGDDLNPEALLERAAQVEPGAAFEFLGALRVLAGALERGSPDHGGA